MKLINGIECPLFIWPLFRGQSRNPAKKTILLGDLKTLKGHFKINWPLVHNIFFFISNISDKVGHSEPFCFLRKSLGCVTEKRINKGSNPLNSYLLTVLLSIPINKLPVEILHQFPFHWIHHCPPFSRWFWSHWAVLGKFFIMSTEFVKNIWDWSHDCTDHENDIGFFMRLVKWPNIAVKKKSQKFQKL